MLTRREFLSATGALAFAGGSLARGARDDLLVRGGCVLDPSAGVDRIADVAIAGGRIPPSSQTFRLPRPPTYSMRAAGS